MKSQRPSEKLKQATGTTKPVQARTATTRRTEQTIPFFGKENYKWMLIGLGVMIVGFLLMAGGGSKDPNVFDAKNVYGTIRITVAPILILAGFIIEIVAIFREPKESV